MNKGNKKNKNNLPSGVMIIKIERSHFLLKFLLRIMTATTSLLK